MKLHWLGKKRLATEANATNFMAIWNLPESARLETQTLNKLATAPWRLWCTNVALSNAPSAQLRPLLDDLVQEECYFEARSNSNQPSEFVLAMHLPSDRAALWQTNLPLVLQSLFGASAEPRTQSREPNVDFRLQTSDFRLELGRSGDWTLFSALHLTNGSQLATLLTAFRDQITVTQTPFPPRTTNYWLELQSDLSWLGRWGWGGTLRTNLPTLMLNVIGENGNVRTTGELRFPSAVPIEMEPWNIPTNLVHDPLISFTAARAFRPLLQALGWRNSSRFGTTPNQATFWVQAGMPSMRFFAFPSHDATNQLQRLDEFLLKEANPQFAIFPNTTNVLLGLFEPVPGGHNLRWRGLPYLTPNLDYTGTESNLFIAGGLFPNRLTNQPPPSALLNQFHKNSDLILFDWEQSKESAYSLIQVSQAIRFVFGRSRLSLTNNPSLPWLVALSTNLAPANTAIRVAGSDKLAFYRTSSVGLTSLELHLLVEWLESPSFPRGLSFFSKNRSIPVSGNTNN